MKTAIQLKALIRNIAKEKKINAQILLRQYMLERLLERISVSVYKKHIILKGGMLIASMAGIEIRSTMDINTTIKGLTVNRDTIQKMFLDILAIHLDDGVVIRMEGIDDILDEAEYGGYRISFNAYFDGINQPFKVDVTTGDIITPHAIRYEFPLLLGNKKIVVMAYNPETVLAEKLEAILSLGTANTRMRDFYDVYLLTKQPIDTVNLQLVSEALAATVKKRGAEQQYHDKASIIMEISTSSLLQEHWHRYKLQNEYAEGISWNDVLGALQHVFREDKLR